MRSFVLAIIAAAALLTCARAAPFKSADLHLSLTLPEKFTRTETGSVPDVIGTQKARFVLPDAEKPNGTIIVHQMSLPDGTDYAQFKAGLEQGVRDHFGEAAKIVRQGDVEQGGWSGFMIEAQVPGNEKDPEPGGAIRHHLRWYLLRDGTDKLVGVIFDARDEAWKDLEPGYATAIQSLKKTE